MNTLYVSLAVAYLRGRLKQTVISVIGVSLGVGFFIGLAAMMQGFQGFLVDTVVDVSPHIVMYDEFRNPPVQPAEQVFQNGAVHLYGVKPETEIRGIKSGQKIAKTLSEMPGINVSPALTGQVFLRYGSVDASGEMIGIIPDKERAASHLEDDMIEGRLENLETNANGIILGTGFAKKLGAEMGDTLTAISPTGVIRKVKIVGLFRTGVMAFDDQQAYTLLKKAQILQDRINVVNSIRMRLEDPDRARQLAHEIEARYLYRTESWQEANEGIFGVFIVQNIIMYSTVSAILVVACFGIYNIISTITNEKKRDIAILKSMGFTEGEISRVFLIQGVMVGLIGSVFGWGVGYFLSRMMEQVPVNIETMVRTDHLYVIYSAWHYVIASTFAFVSSTLAAYLPAHKAAALQPVDIIRGAA